MLIKTLNFTKNAIFFRMFLRKRDYTNVAQHIHFLKIVRIDDLYIKNYTTDILNIFFM